MLISRCNVNITAGDVLHPFASHDDAENTDGDKIQVLEE